MTHTIWKFEIPFKDAFTVAMPADADVLCVQLQGGKPYIWAVVNPAVKQKLFQFQLVGTGHDLPDDNLDLWEYVGTFQHTGGALVWHLFLYGVEVN